MTDKTWINSNRPKEDLSDDVTRYRFESAYSELFQEVHWENVVGSIQPSNGYGVLPTMTPLRGALSWTPQREYTAGHATSIDDLQLDAALDPSTGGRPECPPYGFGQPSTSQILSVSTENVRQQATPLIPFKFNPNLVVPFATSYAQPLHSRQGPRLSSSVMMGGGQQAPKAVQFDLNDTPAPPSPPPPPPPQTYVAQSSSVPVLRNEGTRIRRRGPDVNSINKSRKNFLTEGRNLLFFCKERGCKNFGFTTRGSLKRHVKDKHSGKEHRCPACLRPFADSTSVGRHLRSKQGQAGCMGDRRI